MAKRKTTRTKRPQQRAAGHNDTDSGQPGERMVTMNAGFPASPSLLAHDQIAERAYLTWIAEGRPEDRADEHWFRAEREWEGKDEPQQ